MRATVTFQASDLLTLKPTGNRRRSGEWQITNDASDTYAYLVVADLRAIAKHLTALADELDAQESENTPTGGTS